jgi:hypothetical protein
MSAIADMTKKWAGLVNTSSVWSYSSNGGPGGAPCVSVTAGNTGQVLSGRVRAAGASANNVIRGALWFKASASPTTATSGANAAFLKLHDITAGRQANIFIDTTGKLVVTASGSDISIPTTLRTGTTIVTDNNWHHLQFQYTSGASGTGNVVIKLDGNAEISFSGDTRAGGSATNDFTRVEVVELWPMLAGGTLSYAFPLFWDDTAGGLTGQLSSPHKMEALATSGAGDSTQFTLGAGSSNFSAVGDSAVNDGDTSYVTDSVSGHKDLYQMANMASTPVGIYTVVVNNVVAASDAGSINFAAKVKTGTTEATGSTVAVAGTGYRTVQQEFSTDPSTSAAWTKSGVDGMQSGPSLP